jgi:hypothetical protein
MAPAQLPHPGFELGLLLISHIGLAALETGLPPGHKRLAPLAEWGGCHLQLSREAVQVFTAP